jgi:Cu2+-exporting ATPase
VLVRRLQAFEALSRVTAVVFDKTGTLTHDRLVVNDWRVREGIDRADLERRLLAMTGGSLHPISQALARHLEGCEALATPVVQEVAGQGLLAQWSEGPHWRLGTWAWCGLNPADEPQGQGASPRVHVSDAAGWLATIDMSEGVREDAASAVAALQALGIQTHLLTGDRAQAAQGVAARVGVDHVVAQATPEDKLAHVKALQAQGWCVAMVGDGMNDGPVLAAADTSFALGHAAPLAQAQSDFVVQGGAVMDVVKTLLLARRTLHIVRQNLLWAAAYNAVCVPLALVGWMPPWLAGVGMAGSSLWVIGNAMRLTQTPSKG